MQIKKIIMTCAVLGFFLGAIAPVYAAPKIIRDQYNQTYGDGMGHSCRNEDMLLIRPKLDDGTCGDWMCCPPNLVGAMIVPKPRTQQVGVSARCKDYLVRQEIHLSILQPVLLCKELRYLKAKGIRSFVEEWRVIHLTQHPQSQKRNSQNRNRFKERALNTALRTVNY